MVMSTGVMNGAAQEKSAHEGSQPVELDASLFDGFDDGSSQ